MTLDEGPYEERTAAVIETPVAPSRRWDGWL